MTTQLDEQSQKQELINTSEDYDALKYRTKFTYLCSKCGKECTAKKYSTKAKQLIQRMLLCQKCNSEKTSLERYGTKYPAQSKQIQEKMKQTNLLKYGTEYASQNGAIKEKIKDTFIEKYGVSCSLQNESIKKKAEETCLIKYGDVNSSSSDIVKQKRKNTCNKKFGGDTPFFSAEINEKRKDTMIMKYGTEHALQSDVCKKKFVETCKQKLGVNYPAMNKDVINKRDTTNISKYGCKCSLQNEDVRKKSLETIKQRYGSEDFYFKTKKVVFDGIIFDSYWELCFYIYYKDKSHDIVREPAPLIYFHNNEQHLYYPDFKVDGKLYEIKGDQFFKEDGTMCNPYDHSKDELFEAKHQCAIKNNVIILKGVDIKPFIEYVELTYGKDFKERCILQK